MAHSAPACCRSVSAHLPPFRAAAGVAVPATAGAAAASPPASTLAAAATARNLFIPFPPGFTSQTLRRAHVKEANSPLRAVLNRRFFWDDVTHLLLCAIVARRAPAHQRHCWSVVARPPVEQL